MIEFSYEELHRAGFESLLHVDDYDYPPYMYLSTDRYHALMIHVGQPPRVPTDLSEGKYILHKATPAYGEIIEDFAHAEESPRFRKVESLADLLAELDRDTHSKKAA